MTKVSKFYLPKGVKVERPFQRANVLLKCGLRKPTKPNIN